MLPFFRNRLTGCPQIPVSVSIPTNSHDSCGAGGVLVSAWSAKALLKVSAQIKKDLILRINLLHESHALIECKMNNRGFCKVPLLLNLVILSPGLHEPQHLRKLILMSLSLENFPAEMIKE